MSGSVRSRIARVWCVPAAVALLLAGRAQARTVRINFETGSAALTRPSEQMLADVGAELVEVIAREPGMVLRVTGHTDNVGDRGMNLDLSRKRAEAVRAFLIGRFKLTPPSLVAVGAGPDTPVATNETEEGKGLNRRVEMEIVMPAARAPDASVEWRHRGVEFSKAGEVDWLPVEAGTTLFRLYRVRTQDQSVCGLVFRRGGELTMWPSTLVTVFGGVGESRERLKDGKYHLDLLTGEFFVNLAGVPAEAHRIRTPAAEVESFSSRNWVGVNAGKAALVSIYEGVADVVAQGGRMKVEKGYGVRVVYGQAPETPRPLPAAPLGLTVDDDGGVLPGGKTRLSWKGDSPRYVVQVASDARFRSLLVVNAEVGVHELEADLADGPVWVRVLAVDPVGLKGEFSETVAFAVRRMEPLTGLNLLSQSTGGVLVTSKSLYTVRARLARGCRLFINGVEVFRAGDGAVAYPVDLVEGANPVELRVTTPAGVEMLSRYSIVRTGSRPLSFLYGAGAGVVMGSRANVFGLQAPLPRFGVMLTRPSGLEYGVEVVGLSLWPDDSKLRVKRGFGMFLGGARSFGVGSGVRPYVGMKLGFMEFPGAGRRTNSEMVVGLEAGVRKKVWGPFTAFLSVEGRGAILPRPDPSSLGVGLGFVVH